MRAPCRRLSTAKCLCWTTAARCVLFFLEEREAADGAARPLRSCSLSPPRPTRARPAHTSRGTHPNWGLHCPRYAPDGAPMKPAAQPGREAGPRFGCPRAKRKKKTRELPPPSPSLPRPAPPPPRCTHTRSFLSISLSLSGLLPSPPSPGRPRPGQLRALPGPDPDQGQQPNDGQGVPGRHRKGAARRLPGQDGPGRAPHHGRHPGVDRAGRPHPCRRPARPGRRMRDRAGRDGGRHRVHALR